MALGRASRVDAHGLQERDILAIEAKLRFLQIGLPGGELDLGGPPHILLPAVEHQVERVAFLAYSAYQTADLVGARDRMGGETTEWFNNRSTHGDRSI